MFDHFRFLARCYDRVMGQADADRLSRLLRLPCDGLLLDVGGGTARVSHPLRHAVRAVIVADYSHGMLRQARAKEDVLPLRVVAEEMPFTEAAVDRMLVVDALHHFRDQRRSVGEMLRVLRPGGRLLIIEPDIRRVAVKAVAFAETLALMKSRFYEAEAVCAMARSFGGTATIAERDRFSYFITVDKSAV